MTDLSPQEAALYHEAMQAEYAIFGYKPSPTQLEFHQSNLPNRLVVGGSRCLAGEQEIFDPVLGIYRRVDSIKDDFHVLAWDGVRLVVADAVRPYSKKAQDLYAVELSNGQTIRCTMSHHLMGADGHFYSVAASSLPTFGGLLATSDAAFPRAFSCDPHLTDEAQDYLDRYFPDLRLDGERLHAAPGSVLASLPSQGDAQKRHTSHRVHCSSHADVEGNTPAHSQISGPGDRPSNLYLDHPLHSSGAGRGDQVASHSALCCDPLVPIERQSQRYWPRAPHSPPGLEQTSDQVSLAAEPCISPVVRIVTITRIRQDVVWDFEIPKFHNYECGGVIHHNSGKTACCAVEISWLAMGIHPYKENRSPLSILCLSLTRQNASQVLQRKLFEDCELPGLDGKPLIPENELQEGEHTPLRVGFPTYYRVKLRNGSVIEFAWSSDPASFRKVQGSKRHLIYVDEAYCDRKLLIELQKRLSDARSEAVRGTAPPWYGSLLWGATPTEDSEGFESFKEYCDNPNMPDHKLFLLKPGETGAIDLEVLNRLRSTMTEAEQRVHIDGTESAGEVQRVYPEFLEDRHLLKEDYEPRPCDNLWLCYDPGWDHPTGMFIGCLRPEKPFQKLVVHCWKHAGKSVDYDVACLKHYLRGRALAGVIYDYNAGEQKKNSVSVIQSIRDSFLKEDIRVLGGWYKSKKSNVKGIPLVKSHLDPDHYDKTKEPLLMLNPTPESGGRLMAIEFRKYKGRPATKFSGPNGVIKLNDDLMDPLKYWCAEMVANQWQQTFACGKADLSIVPLSVRPEGINEGPKTFSSKHDELMERARLSKGVKRHQWMIRYQ